MRAALPSSTRSLRPEHVRVLLIDDEESARDGLRWLLADYSSFAVVGEAATFDQAAGLLARTDYDLVFLDLQLIGGTGFDLMPRIRPGARVIFVTAYDQHAIRAFEVNALDYLLKPVSPDRFALSIRRVEDPGLPPPRDHAAATSLRSRPAAERPALTTDDTVLINGDSGDRFVPIADISAVLSSLNYSDVHLRDGTHLFTRRTMKAWEDLLPPGAFARVHRHAIVNFQRVERHTRFERKSIMLHLTGLREPVAVSRQFAPILVRRLGPPIPP